MGDLSALGLESLALRRPPAREARGAAGPVWTRGGAWPGSAGAPGVMD
jgi:hypothetical protein